MAGDATIADAVVLRASAAATATSTGTAPVKIPRIKIGCAFLLDVTAAATAAGDLLDVYVQAYINGTWVDVVHFTQVLGNGGAKAYVGKISATIAETMFNNATALSAGSIRNIFGDLWRVRFDVTSASSPSFTFSVTAMPW